MDSMSNVSGLMSRATKKRSLRKGGDKMSISLAKTNATLINKIQEQLADFKAYVAGEMSRLDTGLSE